jgi:RHS repeat-associated protein
MKITRLSKKLASSILATISIMLAGSAMGQSGNYDGFAWEVLGNGVGIYRYNCTGGAVAIPSTISNWFVISIEEEAFSWCTSLTSITIPNSVTNIGYSAFSECTGLTSVTIGDGVASIGNDAFNGCASLTNVTIGDGVAIIGTNAFNACASLTMVTIPSSVTNMEDGAFSECASLTSVTIPNSVINIGGEAFSHCANLTSAMIGNGVTNIGEEAFYECTSLTSVTIGNGVTSIGDDAFNECTSLTSVTIPNSVISIGADAFYYCTKLTNAIIGNSVINIGTNAFTECTNLTSATIGNNVTNIRMGAFESCFSLTSITIPNSVTSIGEYAFNKCANLANVCFEGNAPTDGGSIFANDSHLYFIFYINGTTRWGATFSGIPTLACAQCSGAVTTNGSAQPYKDVGCLLCQGSQGSLADPGVGDPIRLGNGNKFEAVTDYSTAGANTLSFTRYYNSLGDQATDAVMLGFNWRSTYDRYLRVSGSVIAEREDGQELIFTLNGRNWISDGDVDLKLTESNSVWTLTNSDDSVETYNSGGLLTSVQGRDGYRQTLQYNGGNQLESVSDSFGRTLRFAYQGNLLQTVTTPDGLVLTYGYNSSGVQPGVLDRLASVTYSTTPQTSQSYLYEDATVPFALTGIIDENGSRFATWTYDSSGRATSSQHAGGDDLTTVFYNDTDGSRIVTNALGAATVYKFTTLQGVPKVTEIDRLATETVPAAFMTQTYDGNGYLANSTDWNTNLTTVSNDYRGLLLTNKEAVGTSQARITTNAYLANFHLPVRSAAPRDITTFTYDTNGNRLTLTETDTTTGTVPYSTSGQTRAWTNTFGSLGHVLTVTGPRTDVLVTTTFTYDQSNNVSTITDPLGHVTRITNYNGSGLPLTMIDPNGVVTTFTYDVRDRLLTRTVQAASGNATTIFAYDAVGQVISTTLPNGTTLFYQYDAAHRLQSVSNVLGETINYTLDAAGNIVQQTTKNAGGNLVRTQIGVFDQLSRMLQQIGASGQTTSFAYDADGNRVSITDGLTNATVRAFDALNRLVTSIDPLTNDTAYGYDPQDNLTSVTDPRSLVTSYVYDGFRRVIQESSPDKGTTVYRLDKAGNRTNETDARGIVTRRTFDKLNRVTAETFPASSSENITYSYDSTSGGNFGIGRLTGFTDETGSTTVAYNERGDVISTTRTIGGHAYTTAYTYDLADNISSVTYPAGDIVSYARDTQGRISSVLYSPGGSGTPKMLAAAVTYMPFGPVSGLVYGNGLVRAQNYDLDYRLTGITTSASGANVQNLSLGYDAVNDIISIADNLNATRNQAFAYDPDYRLTGAGGIYGAVGYTYDPDGNRLTRTAGGVTASYTYSSTANKLQSVAGGGVTRSLAYTTNGNLSSDNRGTATNLVFNYGNRNRYNTLTSGSATVATYHYNALGERLVKTVGGVTTHYHYDQRGHLIAESQSNGTLIREYVWLDDMPLAQIESNGAIYYIHPDHLNTPQELTDSAQGIVWDRDQQPFGETVAIAYPAASPPFTSLSFDVQQRFNFTVLGDTNYSYIVEAADSVNAPNWQPLATNTGIFTIVDSGAVNYPTRFYRVISSAPVVTENLRFSGQYFDAESGLNYNMMRDYDPTLGRYIQSDPIGLAGGNNLYRYVGGNPMTQIDFSGLINIYIGGFGDSWFFHQVEKYPMGPNSYYFRWDQTDAINDLIHKQLPCEPINLIGHSYGADTAASIAVDSGMVNLLVTIDPVSWFGPNYDDIKSSVKTWVDVNATGSDPGLGNLVNGNFAAGIGGAWNAGPSATAGIIYYTSPYTHSNFGAMMDDAPDGKLSPRQILMNNQ